jgi:hypothetical protein
LAELEEEERTLEDYKRQRAKTVLRAAVAARTAALAEDVQDLEMSSGLSSEIQPEMTLLHPFPPSPTHTHSHTPSSLYSRLLTDSSSVVGDARPAASCSTPPQHVTEPRAPPHPPQARSRSLTDEAGGLTEVACVGGGKPVASRKRPRDTRETHTRDIETRDTVSAPGAANKAARKGAHKEAQVARAPPKPAGRGQTEAEEVGEGVAERLLPALLTLAKHTKMRRLDVSLPRGVTNALNFDRRLRRVAVARGLVSVSAGSCELTHTGRTLARNYLLALKQQKQGLDGSGGAVRLLELCASPPVLETCSRSSNPTRHARRGGQGGGGEGGGASGEAVGSRGLGVAGTPATPATPTTGGTSTSSWSTSSWS